MRRSLVPILLVTLGVPAGAQEADQGHQKVYRKVRPSVVAIRCLAALGERSGTGVFLDDRGLILTSYSVVPARATKIRVWTAGPRMYRNVEIVGTSKRDELTLLRVKTKRKTTPIPLGESRTMKVGDVCYTVGNSANSIILDNEPSFNVGIISSRYRLSEQRATSWYEGPVLETTAAVNVGMEGAPLLNTAGKMIGFVTQNYSPSRFLGCAIPIDDQKFVIANLKKVTNGKEPEGKGSLGLQLTEEGGKVIIKAVTPGGAAERAGLQRGDVIQKIGNIRIRKTSDLWKRLKGMQAGDIVWLTLEGLGEVKVVIRKKK